jgi:hypothetical protein
MEPFRGFTREAKSCKMRDHHGGCTMLHKQISALVLGLSLLGAPLATSALASPVAGYLVASTGLHATAVPKRHHRLRNAAIAGLVIHHMVKKHRAKKMKK